MRVGREREREGECGSLRTQNPMIDRIIKRIYNSEKQIPRIRLHSSITAVFQVQVTGQNMSSWIFLTDNSTNDVL